MVTVSVVLPCYNGARWIDQAIDSVLSQSYPDFELVIINDGSTDSSEKKIIPYLRDKRVRYISQRNSGFSTAINRGIKENRADLISFIGQDDVWMPEKLMLQTKYLTKHENISLVHSDYFFINSEGIIIDKAKSRSRDFTSRREVIKSLFLDNFIGFETVLVKRKCFDDVGLLDEHMVGFSDHDMWLRITGSFNIGYLALPLVKKRHHELQLSVSETNYVLRDEFLLVKKALDRYPFLHDFERKKLGSLYYSWGITLLQKGNIPASKQKLLKAILSQPWSLKAIAAYIAPAVYTFAFSQYQRFLHANRSKLFES